MKRIVVYLCVGAMMFGLTACGSGNKNNTQSTEQMQTVESQPIQTEEQAGNGAAENTAANEGNVAGEYMDISNGWSEEMNTVKEAVVEVMG